MKIKLLILTALAITILLVGCGESLNLEDNEWILESYVTQGNLKAIIEDTEVTVIFNKADNQVTGSGGCNGYGGSYKLSKNKLTITGPFMSTMMSCGEEKDQQEQQFFKALQSAESYQISDGKLTINCGNNTLVFKQK